MAKLDIFELVAKSEFPLHFKNRSAVQDTLEAVFALRSELLGEPDTSFPPEEKKQVDMTVQKERLSQIQASLSSLRLLAESSQADDEVKLKNRFELYQRIEEMERLERELKGKNAGTALMDRFSSHAEKCFAMALDEWAVAVAQWFATGVLGPGEVRYNGKVYATE